MYAAVGTRTQFVAFPEGTASVARQSRAEMLGYTVNSGVVSASEQALCNDGAGLAQAIEARMRAQLEAHAQQPGPGSGFSMRILGACNTSAGIAQAIDLARSEYGYSVVPLCLGTGGQQQQARPRIASEDVASKSPIIAVKTHDLPLNDTANDNPVSRSFKFIKRVFAAT